MQMLTFSVDDVLYGVDVSQVREVKNFEGVTPVPYAPNYVKGVTNLRGEVIPVIDLRKRFGLPDKKDDASNIMIIVQDKHPVGVTVDSVMEVLTLPKKDIEDNRDSLIVDKSEAVLGIAKHDKDLIILIRLPSCSIQRGPERRQKRLPNPSTKSAATLKPKQLFSV